MCYEKIGLEVVKEMEADINRKSPCHAQAQEGKFINDVNVTKYVKH